MLPIIVCLEIHNIPLYPKDPHHCVLKKLIELSLIKQLPNGCTQKPLQPATYEIIYFMEHAQQLLSPRDFSVYPRPLIPFHSRLTSIGVYVIYVQFLQAVRISSPNESRSIFSTKSIFKNHIDVIFSANLLTHREVKQLLQFRITTTQNAPGRTDQRRHICLEDWSTYSFQGTVWSANFQLSFSAKKCK